MYVLDIYHERFFHIVVILTSRLTFKSVPRTCPKSLYIRIGIVRSEHVGRYHTKQSLTFWRQKYKESSG